MDWTRPRGSGIRRRKFSDRIKGRHAKFRRFAQNVCAGAEEVYRNGDRHRKGGSSSIYLRAITES